MHQADQAARQLAESERSRQRDELAARSWDRGGVILEGTVEGEPVEAEAIDRAALWAEALEQAESAGKTINQWATRWMTSHKKNLEDATDEELRSFVESRRTTPEPPSMGSAPVGPVEGPEPSSGVASLPVAPDEAGDGSLTVENIPRPEQATASDDGVREPGEGQASLLEAEIPIHEFAEFGEDELCAECGAGRDDPVHFS